MVTAMVVKVEVLEDSAVRRYDVSSGYFASCLRSGGVDAVGARGASIASLVVVMAVVAVASASEVVVVGVVCACMRALAFAGL